RKQDNDTLSEGFYKKLAYAMGKFVDHRAYYRREYALDGESLQKTCMRRAVWGRLLELWEENRTGENGGLKKGVLAALYKAYNRIYPDQYTYERSFSSAIKAARTEGVDA